MATVAETAVCSSCGNVTKPSRRKPEFEHRRGCWSAEGTRKGAAFLKHGLDLADLSQNRCVKASSAALARQ